MGCRKDPRVGEEGRREGGTIGSAAQIWLWLLLLEGTNYFRSWASVSSAVKWGWLEYRPCQPPEESAMWLVGTARGGQGELRVQKVLSSPSPHYCFDSCLSSHCREQQPPPGSHPDTRSDLSLVPGTMPFLRPLSRVSPTRLVPVPLFLPPRPCKRRNGWGVSWTQRDVLRPHHAGVHWCTLGPVTQHLVGSRGGLGCFSGHCPPTREPSLW